MTSVHQNKALRLLTPHIRMDVYVCIVPTQSLSLASFPPLTCLSSLSETRRFKQFRAQAFLSQASNKSLAF